MSSTQRKTIHVYSPPQFTLPLIPRGVHIAQRTHARVLAFVFTICLLVVPALAADLKFDDEDLQLTQCSSVNITWTGGIPPFDLIIGRPISATFVGYLDRYTNIPNRFYEWTVDIPGQTVVAFALADSGNPHADVVSHALFINSGPDGCLPPSTESSSITRTMASSSTHSSTARTSSSSAPASSVTTPAPSSAGSASMHKKLLSPYGTMGIALGATVALLAAVAIIIPWRRRRRDARGQEIAELKVELDDETPTSSNEVLPQHTQLTGTSPRASNAQEAHTNGADLDLHPVPFIEQEPDAAAAHGSPRQRKRRRAPKSTEQRPVPFPPALPHSDRAHPGAAPPDAPRQEVDGGVRLAGGPLDEDDANGEGAADIESEHASAIPPPYRRY